MTEAAPVPSSPPFVSPSSIVVSVDGHDLACLQAGEAGRPLMLVHGFTGAKEDFGDWVDVLGAEGWWVIAPDLRGHGASHQPVDESDYSLEIYATELLGLADALGWDRFTLLGHSMGGMAAQEVAVRAPERLDQLVLMDTNHGPVEGLDPEMVAIGMDILRTQGRDALQELLDAMPAERAPSDQRVRDTRPGYTEWNEGKVTASSPAMYAAMATVLANRPDRLDAVAAITVPTLVIVGEEDRNFIGPSRRLAETISEAQLAVIPNAAHSPQFENPEAWYQALTEFLTVP